MERVGLWLLGHLIGEGSFAQVKLATHSLTQEVAAVKIVTKTNQVDSGQAEKIWTECTLLNELKHANIIQLREVTEDDRYFYLFMEYAEGGNLSKYLEMKGPLPEQEARIIFQEIVDAIEFCHTKQVIHKDIKLENILLKNGRVKLADFGLSGNWEPGKLQQGYSGTLAYCPPEICAGTLYCGPEADCWSLGVLLYALVVGHIPFQGTYGWEVSKKITEGDYQLPPHLSEACVDILRRMLTVDPRKRANICDIKHHPWTTNSNFKLLAGSKRTPEASWCSSVDFYGDSRRIRGIGSNDDSNTSSTGTSPCSSSSNSSSNNSNPGFGTASLKNSLSWLTNNDTPVVSSSQHSINFINNSEEEEVISAITRPRSSSINSIVTSAPYSSKVVNARRSISNSCILVKTNPSKKKQGRKQPFDPGSSDALIHSNKASSILVSALNSGKQSGSLNSINYSSPASSPFLPSLQKRTTRNPLSVKMSSTSNLTTSSNNSPQKAFRVLSDDNGAAGSPSANRNSLSNLLNSELDQLFDLSSHVINKGSPEKMETEETSQLDSVYHDNEDLEEEGQALDVDEADEAQDCEHPLIHTVSSLSSPSISPLSSPSISSPGSSSLPSISPLPPLSNTQDERYMMGDLNSGSYSHRAIGHTDLFPRDIMVRRRGESAGGREDAMKRDLMWHHRADSTRRMESYHLSNMDSAIPSNLVRFMSNISIHRDEDREWDRDHDGNMSEQSLNRLHPSSSSPILTHYNPCTCSASAHLSSSSSPSFSSESCICEMASSVHPSTSLSNLSEESSRRRSFSMSGILVTPQKSTLTKHKRAIHKQSAPTPIVLFDSSSVSSLSSSPSLSSNHPLISIEANRQNEERPTIFQLLTSPHSSASTTSPLCLPPTITSPAPSPLHSPTGHSAPPAPPPTPEVTPRSSSLPHFSSMPSSFFTSYSSTPSNMDHFSSSSTSTPPSPSSSPSSISPTHMYRASSFLTPSTLAPFLKPPTSPYDPRQRKKKKENL
eukprot:TRINITY_DN6265_c0_g1_i1.p1 TRINITY_DN6265_c0_g1~~TRINITY_DN6265_c0_g1_i1.p1  ORF type:complete len:1003 (+),score=204.65 TRINITY_DN6265_c0_g1_i1:28-3036(+)